MLKHPQFRPLRRHAPRFPAQRHRRRGGARADSGRRRQFQGGGGDVGRGGAEAAPRSGDEGGAGPVLDLVQGGDRRGRARGRGGAHERRAEIRRVRDERRRVGGGDLRGKLREHGGGGGDAA